MTKHVLLLCGGASSEHEVSLVSARHILNMLHKKNYAVTIGVFNNNHVLHTHVSLDHDASYREYTGQVGHMIKHEGFFSVFTPHNQIYHRMDVVFPIIHGTKGEDGALQGFLESLDVPYVGSNICASAIGMNKAIARAVYAHHNLPLCAYRIHHHAEQLPSYKSIATFLGEPFVVKPSQQGSSVGVHLIHSEKQYDDKVRDALCYDHTIIFEEWIDGIELECAVLGSTLLGNVRTSGVGSISVTGDKMYCYKTKYHDTQGKSTVCTDANIPYEVKETIKKLSAKTFQVLGCSGMARVDFLYGKKGLFLNEINTAPGFTPTSLYPQLWQKAGMEPEDLVDELIHIAMQEYSMKRKLAVVPSFHALQNI